MTNKENARKKRLVTFILFNVIEEAIIAVIAFILLINLAPFYIIPGMSIVVIGLLLFTLVKIYTYWSSASIPVYDPLIGQAGVTLTDFIQDHSGWFGKVQVRGEVWKARAQEPLVIGAAIRVDRIEGLTLQVSKNREQ
ncbi:MAG: NfeD family protein [Candidatus Hodarchaeota archaeon]